MNPKPLKKMKTIQKIWGLLPMTVAALMLTACSSDDQTTTTPQAPTEPTVQAQTIHYTVSVDQCEASTRATVDADMQTLKFAAGDKLYVTGTNIQGVLDIDDGDGTTTGPGTASATFTGELTYTGEGTPADDLELTATLVSAQQTDGTEVTINATTKAVTVNYPTTAFCDDVATAVQKYSNLTGTSAYSERAFILQQKTAFLNFSLTIKYGIATDTEVTATVKNGASTLSTATVTTKTVSGNVMANFVLPVPATTTLSGATVTIGDNFVIGFGGTSDKVLSGKVYNVKKSYAPGLLTGKFSVSDTKQVQFSQGNLQATYNGSAWTWAFAENQWDFIGNDEGNTKVSATTPFVADYSGSSTTVDLFGWVGASSTWDGVNQYGITSSTATNAKDGYGDGNPEALKYDWGTLAISNGGNTANSGWRTLTGGNSGEWNYLLNTRTVNGGTSEGHSYTQGKSVNGKLGIVIYPDGYEGAEYAGDDWATFEAAGCVFLPAAGNRNGSTVNSAGTCGFYWSSSNHKTSTAYRVYFTSNNMDCTGSNDRYRGYSVRLVRDAE